MSISVAEPVEMMIGLPVSAIPRTSGRSPISFDATLYAGTFSFSRKSIAVGSNGDENPSMPSEFASSNSGSCHSHGVCASW